MVTPANIKRNDRSFRVLRYPSTPGRTACSGRHIKYTNLRVPAKNVLCTPGTGAAIVSGCFDLTAMLIGVMSVGIMHVVFDAALAFRRETIAEELRDCWPDNLLPIC